MTWAARGAITLLVVAAALLASPAAVADTAPAPDFSIRLSDGTNFTLSEHRGNVVILDFMYIDCPSCKIAESALKAVYWSYQNDSRYAGRVEVVSIDVYPWYVDTLQDIGDYRQRRAIPWGMGSGNTTEGNIQMLYGVSEVVHIFVVDPAGNLTWSFVARAALDPCALTGDLNTMVAASLTGTAKPITVEQASVYALIAVAAVASFFSPCSFPLLPGYVTHYLQLHAKRGGTKVQGALGGVAAGLGIVVVYGLVGLVVLFAGAAAAAFVPLLQPVVGVILILLGILTLTSKQFYFLSNAVEKLRAKLVGEKENDPRFYLSLFSYGAGYGAAGFGCVAAPFIAATLYATTVGGVGAGRVSELFQGQAVAVPGPGTESSHLSRSAGG